MAGRRRSYGDRRAAARGGEFGQRALDQFGGRDRAFFQVQLAGLDARHGDHLGGQLVQAIGLFVDDGEQFVVRIGGGAQAGW